MKLEVIWKPTIPGVTDTDFVVTFADSLSPNVRIPNYHYRVHLNLHMLKIKLESKMVAYK